MENRLHKVRDGRRAFGEVLRTQRVRAAQVMAILRNLAISCPRLAGRRPIASSLRWVVRSPTRRLVLIGV